MGERCLEVELAAGDTAPVGGQPGDSPDVDPATSRRRNIGLILSLLAVAALLILAALLIRGSDNVTTRNGSSVRQALPKGAPARDGAGPAPGP